MTVTEQAQELKDNYAMEYNESHRVSGEEDNNMKLSQEELELKAKQLKQEYMREWRKNNKTKQKVYTERYWEKKALAEMGL